VDDGALSSVIDAVRRFWPPGWAGYALLALLLVGVALRLVVVVSWWPVTTTLADAVPYSAYAQQGPFDNPQHPAGYSLILATLGALTREVAFTVAIQHLAGIAAALLLFAAVRRVTGSHWAGLLPAGAVLLNPDLIYLEHSIMSEIWFVLAACGAVYCAVRAVDRPDPWYGWPLLAGLIAAAGTMIRSSGIFLIAVIALALLVSRRRPWSHWRSPLAAAAAAAVALIGFATVNALVADRFGIGPSPGWYLYGRVAQFADCTRFEVPAGAEFLCETTPAEERPGANYYLFDPRAPVPRRLGGFGSEDDLLRTWSQGAIRAQPLDYLETVWEDLRSYFVPGERLEREASGGELDPQLDFTRSFNPADVYYTEIQPLTERGMEEGFYDEFSVEKQPTGLRFLRGWQHVTRFGAVALSIATLLVGLGLLIGSRRSRVGVLLFGLGGLSLLIAPAMTGNYVGRYTVPMAGLMMAAAAVTITAVVAGETARRRTEPG
jgi:Dolichyl-phosphate-mannose-protein mannosyltransferase